MREHDYSALGLGFGNEFLVCAKRNELRDEQDNDVAHFRSVFDRRDKLDLRIERSDQLARFLKTVKVVVLGYGEVGDPVFCGNG